MNDYMRRLQQMSRGRGGFPPPGGGRMLGGVGLLMALGGGAWVIQNALFNVDGGHRAIKYRRISGVSQEIFSEGKSD
jgi:prohibitin 2